LIPYFEQPKLHLGPITIHTFGATPGQYSAVLLTVVGHLILRKTSRTVDTSIPQAKTQVQAR